MQLQADLLQVPVEVAAEQETTALGAAALAAGTPARVAVATRYEPEADPADVAAARGRWAVALRRASSSVPG
jgi:glycerol kinase